MAFDPTQYGIKEVADVTFYDAVTSAPVLYFDTLKISNLEFTADTVYARGGQGNPKKIGWDTNRETALTLQDALMSDEMIAILSGNAVTSSAATAVTANGVGTIDSTDEANSQHVFTPPAGQATGLVLLYAGTVDATTGAQTDITSESAVGTGVIDVGNGVDSTITENDTIQVVYTYTITGTKLTFSTNSYPGTYKIIGDTLLKDRDGMSHAYQFIIYKAKLQPGFTMTMEAEGDPSVFDMTLDVLSNSTGDMIDFIKY